MVVDNTELRRAQDARRESEERYRTPAETSPDLSFAIDREHRVRYVNARTASSFDHAPADLVGRPIRDLFDEATGERMVARLGQVIGTGEALRAEGTWSGPSGTAWLSTWLMPHQDETGTVREVLGASRDISQRRALTPSGRLP